MIPIRVSVRMKKSLYGMYKKSKKKAKALLKKGTARPEDAKETSEVEEEIEAEAIRTSENASASADAGKGDGLGDGDGEEEEDEAEDEWVDCGEEQEKEGSVRIDVRLEQRLKEYGVGPLVREQFLTGVESKLYRRKRKLMAIVGTFNVNGKVPGEDEKVDKWLMPQSEADIYVAGFQEVVPLTASNVLTDNFAIQPALLAWEIKLDQVLNGVSYEQSESMLVNGNLDFGARKYIPLVAKSMVGIYLTVWVSAALLPVITYKEIVSVSCGVMRVLGNKGSVGVRLRIYDTYLSFICVHLSSGESESDCARRHWDLGHIFQKSTLSETNSASSDMEVYNILDSDYCFLFGDLNFRLNAEENHIRKMIQDGSYLGLLETDQLRQGIAKGELLQGWQEGEITFPPTFKYTVGTDAYVGTEGDEVVGGNENSGSGSEKKPQKKRRPAWCDRILWKGSRKNVKPFGYNDVADIKISDHKPVFCGFMIGMHEYLDEELDKAIQQARRLADLKEMEGRPCLELPEQQFDFGVLTYNNKVTKTVKLLNTGNVDAHWHLSTAGDKPDWLDVHPVQGKVGVGAESDLRLAIHIEGGIGGSAGSIVGDVDVILVLSVAGSGDKFISIMGKYQMSCFGVSPEELTKRKPLSEERVDRVKEEYNGGTTSSQDPAEEIALQLKVVGEEIALELKLVGVPAFEAVPIVPLEVQNLCHFIETKGGFVMPSHETHFDDAIREAIDSDRCIPSHITSDAASLVLWEYLTSMHQPLLPKAVADVCSLCVPDSLASKLELLQNNMGKTDFATFLFLCKFFRSQRNGLTVDVLSKLLSR